MDVPAQAISAGYTEDPLKISLGARAMGMGGAMAAVSDGSGNVFNNPAGIAGQGTCLTSMYTSLLGDVNYNVAGGNWPVGFLGRQGNMGFGFAGSALNGFVDPDPLGFRYFDYRNNVWLLAYGEKLLLFGQKGQAGLRFKYFDEGFSGSQTDSGRGYNLDAGLIFTPWERTDVGLLAQNILLSALGGKVTWTSGGEESFSKNIKLGVASRWWRPEVLMAVDVDAYVNRNYPVRTRGGVEWQVSPLLALRGGFDDNNPTFGAGLSIGQFVFDYAYHPYFGFVDATTHYFSLSYIGRSERTKAEPRPAAAAPAPLPAVPEAPDPAPRQEFRPAPAVPDKAAGRERVFHYVLKGDRLWDISIKYYGTWKRYYLLAEVNRLADPDLIIPGTWLEIPLDQE